MRMYKSYGDVMKEWLKAYRKNEESIDEQLEKIRELRGHMMSISAQELTDMPKAPGNPKDKMSEYVARLDMLERQVKEAIKVHEESKNALEKAIGYMDSFKMQNIIRYRYLYGYEWSDVVAKMYQEKEDWPAKINNYTRRVYRDHERALEHLARCWNKK